MEESGRSGLTTAARPGEEPTVALGTGARRPAGGAAHRSSAAPAKPVSGVALEATTALPAGSVPGVGQQPAPGDAEEAAEVAALGAPSWGEAWGEWVWEQAGCTILSGALHLVVFIVLALVLGTVKVNEKKSPISVEVEEVTRAPDLLKIELDPQLTLVTQRSQALSSNAEMIRSAAGAVDGGGGGGGGGGGASASGSGPGPGGAGGGLGIDPSVFTRTGPGHGFGIGDIMLDMPGTGKLIGAVPDGLVGDSRAIVGGYGEAMDRLTQELVWMLDKGPVLAIWVFDESESMKDDQKEIRERFEHVYKQLGLVSEHKEDALETAICSYGKNFAVRTRQPTHEQSLIMQAIDHIPNDDTGIEMMCTAVQKALEPHRPYAQKTRRQIAIILVTDESGDRDDNETQLEKAIAEAKAAKAKIYVLGREAVFGYPYAYMRWVQPQTQRTHWLQIDRGPETAFVEQLQTDGLHRRWDAFPSGFGPYESTRMGRETGGIFFMLPSLETNLVRGEKRNYDMEAPYNPDLRARAEVRSEIDHSPLRKELEKVIYDLNPYKGPSAKIIELRLTFSTDYDTMFKQIAAEQKKASEYLPYLAKAEAEVDKLEKLRQQESSPRWQANYDLLHAQLVAYQARVHEYAAYLDEFSKDVQTYLKKPGDAKNKFKPPVAMKGEAKFMEWNIRNRQRTLAAEKIKPFVERSTAMFRQVMAEHAGTPWAARAEWELRRGFGVELAPDYWKDPMGKRVPPPKL